jgi:hypothetical protein
MELGHGMLLPFRQEAGRLYVAFVLWPREPRWTEPERSVPAEHATGIRERIARASSRDMRIGGHLPWKIVVEAGAP